jgi:hypothetical protein
MRKPFSSVTRSKAIREYLSAVLVLGILLSTIGLIHVLGLELGQKPCRKFRITYFPMKF